MSAPRCLFALLTLACVAQASAAGPFAETAWELSQTRVAQRVGDNAQSAPSTGITQTFLWSRRQSLLVGVGLEQAAVPESPFALASGVSDRRGAGNLIVGVGVATSPASRVTWELPINPSVRGGDSLSAARIGLAFQHRSNAAEFRSATQLKLELSKQTNIALRPRAGRVAVTLHSSW